MTLAIIMSSIGLALVFIPLLARRWRVNLKIAVPAGAILGALAGLIANWIGSSTGLSLPVLIPIELALIITLTLLAILAKFYRDPERHPPETKEVILSPADGKVVYVNRVDKGTSLVSTKGNRQFRLDEITATDLITDAAYLVGIDMNVLNVHVNRSPIKGSIIMQQHIKGRFMSLKRLESETVNERVSAVIDNGSFKVGVVQIASRLVRRIVSYRKIGDSLDIGQRIGAIVFGSQVDVVIPELEHLDIEVKVGDEVKAGISVIARYHMPADH